MARQKMIARIEPDPSKFTFDPDAMSDSHMEEFGRVIFKQVREFFSNPAVAADYQKWLAEYRLTHPEKKGVETC